MIKKYMLNVLFFAAIMAMVSGVAQAQLSQQKASATHTPTANSQTTDISRQTQAWHLQPEEWLRYKELMEGPLGIYSPNLDPLTALGISARSDEERQRYARLQVIAETQRVERELAYQRAYDEAFKAMFPNLLPVSFPSTKATTQTAVTLQDRLAVFIRNDCASCNEKVQQLQESGISFDIYMVDSNNDDATIRRWATQVGIDPAKVLARHITLNHDAGRWQSIAIGDELPAVVKVVNGKWQRQ